VAPYIEAPKLSKELDAMLLQLIADRRISHLKEPEVCPKFKQLTALFWLT
jgi:hypothetical protein